MRVPSDRPKTLSDSSVGYYHPIDGKWEFKEPVRISGQRPVDVSIPQLMEQYQRRCSDLLVDRLAHNLSVSREALGMLKVGLRDSFTWAFPMRNSRNDVVGIRLRTDSGKKFAETGSHQGLFIPQCDSHQDLMFTPEGPTNTAAALTLGLYAVGRPSSNSGVWELVDFIKRRGVKRVVVIADTDEDKQRPNGDHYNPGFDGAASLMEQMPVMSCMIALPAKDVRKYVQSGGTGELVHALVKQAVWRRP